MAAAFLSSAQSFLNRSTIWSHYQANGSKITIGMWSVTPATHNSNGKQVSVFEFDKSTVASGSRGSSSRQSDVYLKMLRSEVSKLSRMRHPCMLEVVEPLEETRSGLVFATEPVQCSLNEMTRRSASANARRRFSLEMDEVELQKGLLQVCKALQFLHDTGVIHGNLTPSAIVINAKGDWKLASLAFSRSTAESAAKEGEASPADDYTDADRSRPMELQINLDYAAPECVVHHDAPSPPSDMWSLGCVSYALLSKTNEPLFDNQGRTANFRRNLDNLERKRAEWKRLGSEVEDLLTSLLQRSPLQRVTAASLPASCSYFSSILVSTLQFLDRDTFFSKSVAEQISFLKGLRTVLPRFSDRVRRNRVLPGLLEQGLGKGMRREIVPPLLPNIFYICEDMSRDEFSTKVLPSLKQLFVLQASDPPECALALLEHLPHLQQKCSAVVFKEEMTPLLLSLLSSVHPPLLIKTLQTIPALCSATDSTSTTATLDVATVKDVIFPKVAETFARTTVLGVKVAGLVCLGGLIPILDKYTLTEKLVPMLAKIKTKEPSVLLSCLTIFSLLSSRLTDPIMISTLILPQLWTMSAAPLLDEGHFNRFMALIDNLSQTVKTERGRELRASSRAIAAQQPTVNASEVSWEDLVRGSSQSATEVGRSGRMNGHSDMLSGSLTPDETSTTGFSTPNRPASPAIASIQPQSTVRASPAIMSPSNKRTTLGARPIAPAKFDVAAFSSTGSSSMQPMQPSTNIQPALSSTNAPMPSWALPAAQSNSNTLGSESMANPWASASRTGVGQSSVPTSANTWNLPPPPGFNSGSVLQPSRAPPNSANTTAMNFNGWRDLDPLG